MISLCACCNFIQIYEIYENYLKNIIISRNQLEFPNKKNINASGGNLRHIFPQIHE